MLDNKGRDRIIMRGNTDDSSPFIHVINYNSDDSYLTSIGGGSIQIVDPFGHLISLGFSSSRPFKISKEKKGIEIGVDGLMIYNGDNVFPGYSGTISNAKFVGGICVGYSS